MKTRTTSITACLIAALAIGAGIYSRPTVANDGERFEFGSEIEHPFGERSVKGAPFSAQVIFETTQTLANGVHVSQKLAGGLYRDSEGRTRNELPRDGAPEIVLINDNVAGVLYNLHMFQHSVRKVNISETPLNREVEVRARENRENQEREQMEKANAMNSEREKTVRTEVKPERRVEALGTQTFEGVQAEVKRSTVTIPAGMAGNDRAFDIVTERWYSPELQVVVMSKRTDPRHGETTYRLTNINRSEPSRSLFEAPADFSISEEKTEYRKREK